MSQAEEVKAAEVSINQSPEQMLAQLNDCDRLVSPTQIKADVDEKADESEMSLAIADEAAVAAPPPSQMNRQPGPRVPGQLDQQQPLNLQSDVADNDANENLSARNLDPEDPLAQVIAQQDGEEQPPAGGIHVELPEQSQQRRRCLSQNRYRIATFVIPSLLLAITYATVGALVLFQSNISEAGESILVSSISLQCIYVTLAMREILITIYDCVRGKILDYQMRYVRYTAICCLDGCVVLGMTIYATVAYAMEEKAPECETFY